MIIENIGIYAFGTRNLSHMKRVKRLGRRGGRDCVHTLRYPSLLSSLRTPRTTVGRDFHLLGPNFFAPDAIVQPATAAAVAAPPPPTM